MQSNNPVFLRSAEFNRPGTNAYGNQTYAGNGAAHHGYGQTGYTDPANWGTGTPGGPPTAQAVDRGPMTIDSVVQKTAISLGVVVIAALATWIVTPAVTEANMQNGELGSLIA